MATVYYTDGTFKKYKYYELLKEIEKVIIIYIKENTKLNHINIKRINETNSINMNGLLIENEYDDGYYLIPRINKNIINELEYMFPNVTKIKLSKNELYESDINFKKFLKCEKLYLRNNYFSTITLDICSLKNLRILKISRGPHDVKEEEEKKFIIPKYISKLKNLEILDLRSNYINEIPSEIGKLIKLKKLIMPWNNFEKIPKEIGNLINLEILDLSKGYRSKSSSLELPKEIGNLYNLKELILIGIKCVLPKEIGKLNNLVKINCYQSRTFDHNSNPYEFGGTNFDELPSELWNCKKLNVLYINDFIGGKGTVDNFNNPTLSFQVLLKSKKNIKIFGHYYDMNEIIHTKNNDNIIIKYGSSYNGDGEPLKTRIFTFKDDKLYRKLGSKLLLCKNDNNWWNIQENEENFRKIKNQTYEQCKKVIINNGLLLKNIIPELQTEELCLLAVCENGLALKYVSPIFNNEEIRFEANKQNDLAKNS
jgi:hypothetical protein